MPCTYEPTHDEMVEAVKSTDKEYEILTRLACRYCSQLEKQGKAIPKFAQRWWAKHKQWDITRREQAKAKQQARTKAKIAQATTRALRKAALAKLTAEERAAVLKIVD